MSFPRILGVIGVRDQWPLATVSAVHALEHVIDHLLVVDHVGQEPAERWVAALSAKFPGRVTLRSVRTEGFYQEAMIGLALRSLDITSYDWIYQFDADEFAVADGPVLGAWLAAVPSEVAAVRYELSQYVAPHGVVADDPLDVLTHISHRAVPTVDQPLPGAVAAPRVRARSLSLFELPFPSKVMFRAEPAAWARAGCHGLRWPELAEEAAFDPSVFTVAHAPFLLPEDLERRARHGRRLEASGLPVGHGWQNRVIAECVDAGEHDEFWRRHSTGDPSAPPTEVDRSLAEMLRHPIAVARSLSSVTDRGHELDRAELDQASIELVARALIRVARAEELEVEREAIVADRAALLEMHDEAQRRVAAVCADHAREHQAARETSAALAVCRAELADARRALAQAEEYGASRASQLAEIQSSTAWRGVRLVRGAVRSSPARPRVSAPLVAAGVGAAIALRRSWLR